MRARGFALLGSDGWLDRARRTVHGRTLDLTIAEAADVGALATNDGSTSVSSAALHGQATRDWADDELLRDLTWLTR